MTKQDRQKFGILVVLLAVLGVTLFLAYGMNRTATRVEAQTVAPKTSSNPPAPSDARIRLDLVEKPDDGSENIGIKNVFQYRQAPPPPPPKITSSTTPPPSTTPFGEGGGQAQRPAPVPPPPIPLKYSGYADVGGAKGGLTAFLADDSRHYNVTVGEVLMGRYRIAGISDRSVEVEDLELNRRQVLPLQK